MYTFKENIPQDEFDGFVSRFSFAPITQMPAWSELKTEWSGCFCGVYSKDNELCAAALMLVRKLVSGFKLCYCPRGPLLDYTDSALVAALFDGMKTFAKNHGCYAVKFDPLIARKITPPALDAADWSSPFPAAEHETAHRNLLEAGFVHTGYGLSLKDNIQPRFNMIVPLAGADGEYLDEAHLRAYVGKAVRKHMGTFASNRGMYFESEKATPEAVSELCRILKSTEQRQQIFLRGKAYFERLADSFGDNARIFFVKSKLDVYAEYLKNRMPSEQGEQLEKTRAALAQANEYIEKSGKLVTLAAALVVLPPNDSGDRMAEYLYAGSDLSDFSAFCAADGMLFGILTQMQSFNCKYLNLGGVEGTLDDGLYDFKRHFNPMLAEFHGEYLYIANSFKYKFAEKALPMAMRAYKSVFSRLKK